MKIKSQDCVYAFSKENAPVAKVQAPCHLVFETPDALGGQVQTEKDLLDGIDFSHVNPATGPVFIQNAQKGDTLAVHIKTITLDKQGAVVTTPGLGIFPEAVQSKTVICPVKDGHYTFCGVDIPLNPMIGVIGVAPEGEAALRSRSDTMPTSLPSLSTTGRRRILRSRSIRPALIMDTSSVAVTTFRDIQSPTSMLWLLALKVGRTGPHPPGPPWVAPAFGFRCRGRPI